MKILLATILSFCSLLMSAQNDLPVSGAVRSSNSKTGQAGARVVVDGTTLMAMTDEEGHFTVMVPSYDVTLVVSAPGCQSQKVFLKGRKTVNVFLLSKEPEAVEKMNLHGEALSIKQSGDPWAATRLFVRGLHSINLSSQPLYIVDGVVWDMQEDAASGIDGYSANPLSLLDDDDIERVDVLKDGTAIWGAKAASGVISITTKRAHDMATRIEAIASMGVTQKCSSMPMMDASDYRLYATDVMRGMSSNDLSQLLFTNDDRSRQSYYETHNNTDWLSQINRNAMLQHYGINVAGGDDKALYRFSIGYAKNESNISGSDFNRLNVRFNSDVFLNKHFSLASDIYYVNTDAHVNVGGLNEESSPYYIAMIKSPLYAPYQYNSQGLVTNRMSDVDELNVTNPIAVIGDQTPQVSKQRFALSLKPHYVFNDRFSLTALLSFQWDKENQDSFLPDVGVADMPLTNGNGEVYATGLNEVRNLMARQSILSAQAFADWDVINGWKHELKMQGGMRFANNSYRYNAGRGYNTGSDFMKALSNTNSSLRWITGDSYTNRDLAWYLWGRYSYLQRYALEASTAIQTSSRYGKNAGGLSMAGVAWMPTFNVEASWDISAEKWMQPLKGFDAKLRLGWNQTGNDLLPINASRTTLHSVALAQNAVGNAIASIGNDELKWETTRQWNVGLDMSFFNNRWQLSADCYHSVTDDLLLQRTLAEETGLSNYWANGGKLKNIGFSVSTNVRALDRKDWKLTVSGVVSHYKNEVTELPEGSFTTEINGAQVMTAVGQPVGIFYGYETNGVYSNAEEAKADDLSVKNDNGSLTAFGAGDMRFVDHCADGIIDDKDRVVIGDPNPDFFGRLQATLSWKRFTVTPVFTFSVGGDVYNALRACLESGSDMHNQTTAMRNRWTVDGQITDVPRATYGDPMGNSRFSDRWIEDGSCFRMKSITLSYDIPFQSAMLQNVRIWASVNNLFTLTKYLGADPECSYSSAVLAQGIDLGLTPQSRSFVIGVKVNL